MLRLQLTFLLLVSLGCVHCQSGANKEVRKIPQWGVGLIAVTVFLFLVLVVYVGNIWWNKNSKSNLESVSMGEFGDGAIPNGSTGRYITKSNGHDCSQHVYENKIVITDVELSTPGSNGLNDCSQHAYENKIEIIDDELSTPM